MKKTRVVKINIFFVLSLVFVFCSIIFKLIYINVSDKVDGIDIDEFASNRNTKKETVVAPRGTIYSSDGEVLAKDVNSYTVIAYLSESRTTDINNPHHVIDKEMTAKKLSPLINMKKESILKLLNMDVYQVELGPGGRGITELVKDKIEELDLPGIGFLSDTKRYYPNSDFASYTLGYARKDEYNIFNGEMGVELYFNDELTGKNGYVEYQQDRDGYQITSLPSIYEDSVRGNDIHLTIDTNVQMFVEQALSTLEKDKPEWATISVVNAKSGEILGTAATPSFNNNTLEIKSYYDPLVSYTYEPGSTMKIFSFMAAMENGIYDGEAEFKSGTLKVDDATIKDWNKYGWGKITYDEGFMGSSNVAASKLALELGRAKLKDFYNSLGFGEATGITLPNESKGIVNFKYNTEVAAASYGQGMTVSAIQMIKALTVLANDGEMINPYIVSKVIDSEGNIVKEYGAKSLGKKVSSETVSKMIKLMRGVVDGSASMSTGTDYYVKGYDLIGKTGTAEIASSSGGYLENTYVRSFAGLFPGKDPEYIIYVASSKAKSSNKIKTVVKSLVKDISTYYNIDLNDDGDKDNFILDSYISKNIDFVKDELDKSLDVIVLGSGDRILSQYPSRGSTVNLGDKVFLRTNNSDYVMPNISGWSKSDVSVLCNMIGISVSFEGYGYVSEYSIKSGSKITVSDVLSVKLEKKFKEEEKKE